jgi:hypothetical protein
VDANNPAYKDDNGVLFNKTGNILIAYPAGKSGTRYTIPEGVTSIGDSAFSDCTSLASITLPDSVTSIGNDAFSGCTNLSSITLPKGVTSIGYSAFFNCEKLASIIIPESVMSIGNDAFTACENLTFITIPENVTNIGENAFYSCRNLIVNTPAGSYAEKYAKKNGIKCSGEPGTAVTYNIAEVYRRQADCSQAPGRAR